MAQAVSMCLCGAFTAVKKKSLVLVSLHTRREENKHQAKLLL